MPHLSFPILHAGDGYPEGFLHSAWRFEPSVVLGVFALIAGYVAWTGPLNRRRPGFEERPVTGGQTAAFIAGCLVILIALGPPLDDWSDNYLLSAHMAQHLILMLLVAPLWFIGLPAWVLRPLTRNLVVNRVGRTLTRPLVAFLIANAALVLWHMPSFYNASLESEPVHIAMHLTFIGVSVLAWWPILGPLPEWPRLPQILQCLYLFLMTIPRGIVGAFITLSEPGLYEAYAAAPRLWGISLATDQELAGLLMWVIENLIYLILITVIFFKWAGRADREARGESACPAKTLSPVARQ
ncbi:MAG: cytochrome c oxidase assembly protein [Thermomicrobiales bacterium]